MKRTKRRYLALQIEAERMPSERNFIDAIWSSLLKTYGEFGASQTGLAMIYYDVNSGSSIIRTSLTALSMVRASVAMITSLTGAKASVHVLCVSGTIKSLSASHLSKNK